MLLEHTAFIASFKYTVSIYQSHSCKAVLAFIAPAVAVSDSVDIQRFLYMVRHSILSEYSHKVRLCSEFAGINCKVYCLTTGIHRIRMQIHITHIVA